MACFNPNHFTRFSLHKFLCESSAVRLFVGEFSGRTPQSKYITITIFVNMSFVYFLFVSHS